MRKVFAWFLLYLSWAALIGVVVTFEGHWLGVDANYGEHSLVEYTQSALLVVVAVLFFVASRISAHWRGICIALTFAAAITLVREQDNFLDGHVYDGTWQVIVTALLFWAAVVLWRHRTALAREIETYAATRMAGLLAAGFLTVFIFSRIAGSQKFWRSLMGDRYLRVVKNAVEEGLELFGYSLIMLAAIETLLYLRRLTGSGTRKSEHGPSK